MCVQAGDTSKHKPTHAPLPSPSYGRGMLWLMFIFCSAYAVHVRVLRFGTISPCSYVCFLDKEFIYLHSTRIYGIHILYASYIFPLKKHISFGGSPFTNYRNIVFQDTARQSAWIFGNSGRLHPPIRTTAHLRITTSQVLCF